MSGRTRSTVHLIEFTISDCPPTTSTRNRGRAAAGRRRYSSSPIRMARGTTTAVPPSQVMRRRYAVDASVAFSAAHSAGPRSKGVKSSARASGSSTPNTTAVIMRMTTATVRARPVAVAGSVRRARALARRGRCSISWATARPGSAAGSALGQRSTTSHTMAAARKATARSTAMTAMPRFLHPTGWANPWRGLAVVSTG